MSMTQVILGQFYTSIVLASGILFVKHFGLRRALSAVKIGKVGKKSWNTGN